MVNTTPTVIPNPDPSVVTSEAIDRRVTNAEAVINARLEGMEKAVQVFQADLTRVPTQLDRAISSLRDLIEARLVAIEKDVNALQESIKGRDSSVEKQIIHLKDLMSGRIDELAAVTTERFIGVGSQFAERDTRTDQRAGDTKLAVDAAFAAAKEATSKIEAGFTKSIDGQQELLTASLAGVGDKISDLKDRVTALENRTIGITTANAAHREVAVDQSSRTFAMVSIAVSIISVVVVIAIATHSIH